MELKKILDKIITPDFLRLVEKYSRYKGKYISIGDYDYSLKNKGTFRIKSTIPKMVWGNNSFKLIENETETITTVYDVTEIRDCSTCSNIDTVILIAERIKFNYKSLPDLFVFGIKNKSKKSYIPNFNRLKSDFKNGKITGEYRSLLHEFCGHYTLSPFNNYTDRIFNFTMVENILNNFESDKEIKNNTKNIKLSNWNLYK